MSSVKSRKAKGRRLQNDVCTTLYDSFHVVEPSLEPDDVKSQTMGMCGEDIVLSPAAQKVIKYSFECKNQERLDLWGSLQQAEDNCSDRIPVLVFKRNRSNTYATIPFDEFIRLIQNDARSNSKSKR